MHFSLAVPMRTCLREMLIQQSFVSPTPLGAWGIGDIAGLLCRGLTSDESRSAVDVPGFYFLTKIVCTV